MPWSTYLTVSRSVERYGKWVSISNPDQLSESSPQGYALLKSVLCLLATRFHAEISVYSTQEIYHHVKRLTASAIIDTPSASLSVVQALTLLCMWSPAIRTEKPLDSWHLSGTTAGLAILAFKLGKPITITDKTPAQNLRIWSSLCLAHLQSVQSLYFPVKETEVLINADIPSVMADRS